jgi:LmbE family N-acetylglucosaminyl deacetylase
MMTIAACCAAMDALPFEDPDAMVGSGRALILAPHPDDESLGCGGLIATLCARGRPPLVAIMTDGAGSHPATQAFPAERLIRLRRDEVRLATQCLGLPAAALVCFDWPDAALPAGGTVVDDMVSLIRREGCSAIFAPSPLDPHCDHVATAAIAAQAAAATELPVWSYPVWALMRDPQDEVAVEAITGWRLDIAGHLAAKRAAIEAHRSQHGAAIADLPAGFRLPPEMIARFTRPFEIFIAS